MAEAPDSPRNHSAPRFTFLDSMRGFAASWVAIFHINKFGSFEHTAYYDFMMSGGLGVTIFFVISGYAVHSSLLRSATARDFLARRFWRIYPPYIASLVVVMAVVIGRRLLTGTNDLIGIPKGLVGWIQTLTLTTQPFSATPPINWVYWTLTYEVAFYLWLSLALVVKAARWPLLFIPLILAGAWPGSPLFIANQWSFFALGAAIAEGQNGKSPLRQNIWPFALAIGCLTDMAWHHSRLELAVAMLTGLLIVASTVPKGMWLNREKVFRHLGDWSYSIYLTHLPIACWLAISAIDPWPRRLSQTGLAAHIAVDLAAFAATVLFSYGFWRWIERPSIRLSQAVGRKPSPVPTIQPLQAKAERG